MDPIFALLCFAVTWIACPLEDRRVRALLSLSPLMIGALIAHFPGGAL